MSNPAKQLFQSHQFAKGRVTAAVIHQAGVEAFDPMTTANFSNVTFDEIEVGKGASLSRAVTNTEVEALALVSGEVDPYHVEPGELVHDGLPVAQGVGAEAIISGLLNRRMPGPGTRILSQSLAFDGEIRVGDEIVATVTPREKRDGRIVVFECTVNASGRRVASGTVTVEAPKQRIAYDEIATPQIILRHNDAFTHLLKRCEGIEPVTCAIVHPCERDSLLGAARGRAAQVNRAGADRARGEDPRDSRGGEGRYLCLPHRRCRTQPCGCSMRSRYGARRRGRGADER